MEKLSDLKGKAVVTLDGKSVGRLADLSIDDMSWKVASLVVDVDPAIATVFGVKKKLLQAPKVRIGADKVEHVADVIKLRESLQQLKVELHGG